MTTDIDLRNLTLEQLSSFCSTLGLSAGRSAQLFSWLQRPEGHDFAAMTDIRRPVRELLARQATISRLTPAAVEQSADGTVKFGFRLADGALVESVLIPEKGRHTLCLSSQAGCAMGCSFCCTGRLGLVRNLRPAEMVNQVLAAIQYLREQGVKNATPRDYINNLVFMGMGEPLANYDNQLTTLAILMEPRGLEFTPRRVTVSTCGLVPRIEPLGRATRVNLAVSLHAADDETRNRLMPVNKRYGIDQLLAACRAYPLGKRQVILFEYTLIQGVNDSPAAARKLAARLDGIACRINLLPYNESDQLPYRCPDGATIQAFRQVLHEAGFRTLVRSSRGQDINAACGQLAGGLTN